MLLAWLVRDVSSDQCASMHRRNRQGFAHPCSLHPIRSELLVSHLIPLFSLVVSWCFTFHTIAHLPVGNPAAGAFPTVAGAHRCSLPGIDLLIVIGFFQLHCMDQARCRTSVTIDLGLIQNSTLSVSLCAGTVTEPEVVFGRT